MEAVPVRNRWLGVTGKLLSMSASPKPSAPAVSPWLPTATESPARLFADMLWRTIWRACSAVPAHVGGGGKFVTDEMLRGSGWTFVAVMLMYTNSPGIP